jgi:hypothetical protein
MSGISIPALLRSNCVRITAVELNKELAGFSLNSRSNAATEERMIQIQLQPDVEAQLAAEAQARGLAQDHYIEMIVRRAPSSRLGNGRSPRLSTVFGSFAKETNSVASRAKI